MRFIDSHTHLDFDDFKTDRKHVIQRAADIGVSDIIVSATTAERWPLIHNTCNSLGSICHAAYGLHPMFMQSHILNSSGRTIQSDLDKLDTWLTDNKAIAVGEIGLDFFIEEADELHRIAQEQLFISQCEIAQTHKLPVIIHARKSLDIILKHLRRFPTLRGCIHSFSGSEQQAKQLIDLGFYLSFGGPVTYSRATRLHKLIKTIPLNALLIETDSPDQPDDEHHSQRNEPAYIVNVARKIAAIKQVEIELVAEETTKNAIKIYSL